MTDLATKGVGPLGERAVRGDSPTVSHWAEYALLRGTIGALGGLGWKAATAAGSKLALLGYSPLGIRRSVVEQQVAFALPALGADEVRRVSRDAYASLGRTTVETALLPSLTRDQLVELVEETEGLDVIDRAVAGGRGGIIVTGHLGNWELGGAYLAALGYHLSAVVRRQGNPLFDEYLNRTRRSMGNEVVYDRDSVRRIPRALAENRLVALVSDQGVLTLASTFVPFFGRLAKTPRGPAVFALRLGVPVIFGAAIRKPNGRFRLAFEEVPVNPTGDREADVDRIVADYTNTLERWVREEPEQYFWHHKRWKRQPAGSAVATGDSAAGSESESESGAGAGTGAAGTGVRPKAETD